MGSSVTQSGVLPLHGLVANDGSQRRSFSLPCVISKRLPILHLIFVTVFRKLGRNVFLAFRMLELFIKRVIGILAIEVLLKCWCSWSSYSGDEGLVNLVFVYGDETIEIAAIMIKLLFCEVNKMLSDKRQETFVVKFSDISFLFMLLYLFHHNIIDNRVSKLVIKFICFLVVKNNTFEGSFIAESQVEETQHYQMQVAIAEHCWTVDYEVF